MNFMKLTGFWKKRGRKEANDVDCSSSNDPGQSFPHDQQLRQGHRAVVPFESKQLALNYITRLVESTGRSVSDISYPPHDDDEETPYRFSSYTTAEVTSPALNSLHDVHFSKETVGSLLQKREEMVAALDLCLLSIPDELTVIDDSNAKKDGVENVQTVVVENLFDSQETTAEVNGADNIPSAPGNSSTISTTTTTPHTLQQWRRLLYQLVGCLVEIDRVIYTDAALRSRQTCLPHTPLCFSPLSSGKVSFDRHGTSPLCSVRNSFESSNLPDVQQSVSSKKRTSCASLKALGGNGMDDKPHEMRKAEELTSLAKALTTWIILLSILRHQLEPEFFCCSTPVEPSTLMKTTQIKYDIPVSWSEVIEDLMKVLGTTQQIAVEVLISLWILCDTNGHERVQCILQKPLQDSGDSTVAKLNPLVVDAGDMVSKTADGQAVSPSITVSLERVAENVCMDDLVEHVEHIYEQNVVLTWVMYIEQQSTFLFGRKTENQDENATPMDLRHCHMMATYALCSPYWSEEKQQQGFQLLHKLWEESDQLTAPQEASREFSPVVVIDRRSQSVALEKSCELNSLFSVEGSDSNGCDTPPRGSQKRLPVPRSTPEKETNTSEEENPILQLVSLYSSAAYSSAGVVHATEALHTTFGEDVLFFMTLASWCAALHLRVEQCLSSGTLRIKEAEYCANKEYEVAHVGLSFSYWQGALESLVKVRIIGGKYSEAVKTASVHFSNAKKEWSLGKYCHTCGISYLNSMLVLAQAQEACQMDASFVETAQLALQQAKLCEEALKDSFAEFGTHVVRHAAARRGVYNAKLFYLREIWRVYHRMDDITHAEKYFEQYMEHIQCGRRSKRGEIAYAALKERGKQLEEEKQYGSAALLFRRAVEEAKKMALTATATNTRTSTSGTMGFGASNTVNTVKNVVHMGERELKLISCEAESERNLAIAYLMQAKHEVNVRERRKQLNNAVNSAYAAQNALQRCISKVKTSSNRILIDVASSLVVAAEALLRLGQPKKAALLLEPLIEDKMNSASVRPPLWSNALPPFGQAITAADMTEYIETVEVKLATYDVHTQCLSKFDGERACREVKSAQKFLEEVSAWISPLLVSHQGSDNKDAFLDEQCLATLNIGKSTAYRFLQKVNALRPLLTITFGDSLTFLGKWEDALQEYSNALAMHVEEGDINKNSEYDYSKTAKEKERFRNEKRMGESLVLAKLAEVYTAINKPKTAMHYYRQVLDYALEVDNALLQYNALIHLARLHTVTRETEDAGKHWEKVSELAKEYEDNEINRETTRNIVAAQRANGMYTDVLNTAKELDTLASAAEGVDAAADKRFALEALADAYLHLGQHKKCIDVLDEREKVQYKCGQWNEPLFIMRARALLGDGAVHDAIKVLMIWENEARQLGDWVEVGHANAVLALAYATTHQLFKARRHHEIALSAFSKVLNMDCECRNVVTESAQWLVHHFYLNNEELPLNDAGDEEEENNLSGTVTRGGSSSANSGSGNSESGSSHYSNDFQVQSLSGDLNVLMQEEERRLKEHLESVANIANAGSCNSDSVDSSNLELMRDGEKEKTATANANEGDKEMLKSDFIFSVDMASMPDKVVTSANPGGCTRKNVTLKSQNNGLTALTDITSAPQPSISTPITTLANVTHCKCPAVMEGEVLVIPEPNKVNTPETTEAPPPHKCTRMRTLCFHRALETMETAAQLLLIPLGMRKQLIPRNPVDVVDLALLAYPRCTFVFYYAEFATQYRAIIRPAARSFFLMRSVQVYSLEDFHSKKQSEQLASRQEKTSVNSESSQQVRSEPIEKRMSAFASSLSSLTRRSRANSEDTSLGTSDYGIEWAAIEKNLQRDLQNMHADLWAPLRDLMQTAQCCNDEAECLAIIVDPVLLHVPFPALYDSEIGADPLGQQFAMVVAPTVVNFLQNMYNDEESSLLDASEHDRCVLLPEQKEKKTLLTPSFLQASYRKPSTITTKDSTSTSLEDATVVTSAASDTWLSGASRPWTLFTGCTRKEVVSAFSSPSCRALMLLCDPVGHLFKVADGMVRLSDMTRGRPCLTDALDLMVVTCDRSTAPSADEPGVAARLCLDHGCRRVLRLDLSPGMSITAEHRQLLHMYVENLMLTLEWRMRYPYALALRMTQEDALRHRVPAVVWASLTLIGAA